MSISSHIAHPNILGDICQRYLNGQTRTSIARLYHVHPSTIREALIANGVTLREVVGKGHRKLTREQEAEVAAEYAADEPLLAMRRKWGVMEQTIRNIAKRHGVPDRTVGGRWRHWTPEQLEQIRDMIAAGKSRHAICEAFQTKPSTLYLLIHTHRLKEPRTGIARREYAGNWTGGRHINAQGYVQVMVPPDHPEAGARMSIYVLEHRAVMAAHLGRPLRRDESVHHINGDKTDNRIENLQLRQGKHGNGVAYVCMDCGSHNVKPVSLSQH